MSANNSTSCDFMRPELHHGGRSQFLARYEDLAGKAMSRPPKQRGNFHERLLSYIADTKNLKAAWDRLKRKDSQGAGPDGRTFADFTRQEALELIRKLSQLLLDGTYHHGRFRLARIPKHLGSSKKREIWIANVADRVVARATAQILAPLFEATLPKTTFCRRGHGRLRAIATAKVLTQERNVTTWITQDLTDAFPSVPKQRLLQIVSKFVGNEQVTSLVANLIENEGQSGIPAGSPIASLLLTLYVHQTIARIWQSRHPQVPILVYLDDFLLLAGANESLDVLFRDLEQIANSAGFKLKYTQCDAVTDLNCASANWLGYTVTKRGGDLGIRVAWTDDEAECKRRYLARFINLHSHPDAVLLAPKLIDQIVAQASPAFRASNVDESTHSLLAVAIEAGFEELPTKSSIRRRWQEHHDRWCCLVEPIENRNLPPSQRPSKDAKPVTIYTDGCCLGKSGVGGWAYCIVKRGKRVKRVRGGLKQATNNRAELLAAIRALESLRMPSLVRLYTDSRYVAHGICLLPQWRERGWRAGLGRRKRDLKNLDLWRRVYELCGQHEVLAEWIRGHSGCPHNEWCDQQAQAIARLTQSACASG